MYLVSFIRYKTSNQLVCVQSQPASRVPPTTPKTKKVASDTLLRSGASQQTSSSSPLVNAVSDVEGAIASLASLPCAQIYQHLLSQCTQDLQKRKQLVEVATEFADDSAKVYRQKLFEICRSLTLDQHIPAMGSSTPVQAQPNSDMSRVAIAVSSYFSTTSVSSHTTLNNHSTPPGVHWNDKRKA